MDEQQTPLTVSIPHDEVSPSPPLPPRPTGESLLSPTTSMVSSHSREFSLRRKPVTPRRSSRLSLDKRSYDVVEMTEADPDEGDKKSIEESTIHFLPAKAFYKTHQLFRWDLGYWRMPARHFSIFSILFLITFLPSWYSQYGFNVIHTSSISPFNYDCNDSIGWSFVGISLQFGEFSFGQAKAIDLAWNWVVGRGLQGILSILAYRVFCDALVRVTELTAVSYDLYVTLALPSTKIESLWKLCPTLFKYGGWRVKTIFLWMIISTIYLITVPGLMDAATAYESSYTTNFRWPNGSIDELQALQKWDNNPRIARSIPICVTFYTNSSSAYDVKDMYNFTYVEYDGQDGAETDPSLLREWEYNCSSSVRYHYTGPPYANKRVFNLFDWKDQQLNDSWWAHYKDHPYESLQVGLWPDWGFYPSNASNFRCSVNQQGVYQWGFSFEWLFVITILNSIWLWGMWILWVDCDTNSEFCTKRRRLGVWRAIADIAEAMQESLGPKTCAYSEEELWEALKMQPPIKYYSTRPKDGEPGHIGLSVTKSERFRLLWNQEYGKKDR